jgi:iron complex transport system ATP-binding protein
MDRLESMSTDVLNIRNLTLRRGPTTILEDINWRIAPGEHWALLGANGSGKSSLLQALAGYLPASEGSIQLLGETYGASYWPDMRKRLGLVASAIGSMLRADQEPLYLVAAGKEAMLNDYHRGEYDAATLDRAETLLLQAGLGGKERRSWQYLSQGERQRVLIARALMPAPEILILDEPCSGLDPISREAFLHHVEELAAQSLLGGGPTLVLVTHHIEEIMPSFNKAIALAGGKVVANGPIGEVLTGPVLSQVYGAPVEVTEGPYPGRKSLILS